MWQVKYNNTNDWTLITEGKVYNRIRPYCDNIIHLDTEIERLKKNPGECFDTQTAVYRYMKDEIAPSASSFEEVFTEAARDSIQELADAISKWKEYIDTHDCCISDPNDGVKTPMVVSVKTNICGETAELGRLFVLLEDHDIHDAIERYTGMCAAKVGIGRDDCTVWITEA